jgi:hypothetical protein
LPDVNRSCTITGEIASLTAELQVALAELTKHTNIGREGFDNLGKAITEPTGLMEELILKAHDLQLAIIKATSPEEVATLNAELQTTNAELTKMRLLFSKQHRIASVETEARHKNVSY